MTTRLAPITRAATLTEDQLTLIKQIELELLSRELPDLRKFRAYYNGEHQNKAFLLEKFKEEFGEIFEDFRDNWCAPVIEAIADKLVWEGIVLGTNEAQQEQHQLLSEDLWNIFRENDIDEQQSHLFEGALVEGRSYMIVWPDDDMDSGVRMDWNPADLIRVRYADDDPRRIIWGMKRWLTPSGEIYITEYTRDNIFKWREAPSAMTSDTRTGIDAQRPTTGPTHTWERREVPNESWPLENPYNVVPIVEFLNKNGSELEDCIPLQDAVNFLVLQALGGASSEGIPQKVMHTGIREPTGGWRNSPGKVWQIKPDIDPDGNLHYGKIDEFRESNLSGLRELIEMVLQHLALQSKTPVRMFFKSDRGGRGDAPSGESMLVEDQPLLDKVSDRQRRFGNAGMRLARLVALMSPRLPDSLPLGEMNWHDPRSRYRTALIEEGAVMVDKIGLPTRFVITQLGLSKEEQDLAFLELENQAKESDQSPNGPTTQPPSPFPPS